MSPRSKSHGQYQFALHDNKNDNDNENDNKNENSNESKNENENENDNKNENSNENTNELKNDIDNKLDNSVDNKVDNEVDNKVDNDVKNNVENHVENKVDVAVDVKIDLDLTSLPTDNDVIDIDKIEDIHGSVVMPDAVEQHVTTGNAINIDQVNNLVDRDWLKDPEVSYDAKGDFKMDAYAEGGEVKVEDAKVDISADGASFGDTLSSSADASISQEAFTQNIVMGANIQFNSIDMNVAGTSMDNDTDF